MSLTLNPDFGQVEADPAQVNLSAFELFFPEQRPFFLEGADLFEFGGGELFYSRRIGRPPQGATSAGSFAEKPDQTRIAAAAKLTGRTVGGWSFGILDALTREETARLTLGAEQRRATVEPAANYFVGRLARDVGAVRTRRRHLHPRES